MSQTTETPLPAPTPEMIMATAKMISQLEPESFVHMPGTGLEMREARHLDELTGGEWGANWFRRVPGEPWVHDLWHIHHVDFQLTYILKGSVLLELEGIPARWVGAGSVVYQPGNNRHRTLDMTEDLEAIEVSSPARFKTTAIMWDEEAGEYKDLLIDTVDDAQAVVSS